MPGFFQKVINTMKITQKDIEGHRRLQFKTASDAGKAHQKVKKMLKKVSDDETGILVLTGTTLILPQSLKFNPSNVVEL